MNRLGAVFQLIRLDSSLLGSIFIFLPLYSRTGDLSLSIKKSIPLLFIYICTFIANDLDDFEKDCVNHPNRPLPKKIISPILAAIFYFISLSITLFSTKLFIRQEYVFWYYAIMVLAISYHYIIEYLSSLKAIYVATTISLSIFLIANMYPKEKSLILLGIVSFLFVLGRELCMDIIDRVGDAPSYWHRLNPRNIAKSSFFVQIMGLFILPFQFHNIYDIAVIFLMCVFQCIFMWLWLYRNKYKIAIVVMKIQFFVGAYFLL